MIKYPAIVHDDPDGFWVEFPDLKGCATQGDTMKELIYNAQEALSLYLEEFVEDNEPPVPSRITGKNIIEVEPLPDVLVPIILRKIRKGKNLSQKDMARLLRVSYQAYQKLENIKHFNATIKTLEKIAKALGKKLIVDFQ